MPLKKYTGAEGSLYDTITNESTDEEKLSVALKGLEGSIFPGYVRYSQLKIAMDKELHFDALLESTGLVDRIESANSYHPGYKLNAKGLLVMQKFGDYTNYIEAEHAEIERQEVEKLKEKEAQSKLQGLTLIKMNLEIENLTKKQSAYDTELRKLNADVVNAERQSKHYKSTRVIAFIALGVAIVTLLLKGLELFGLLGKQQ